MFYLVGIFRTSSLGGSISSNPERTALRRRGGRPGYIEVLQRRAGSQEHQEIIANFGYLVFFKEFSAFLWMGKCKSLGSLNSFL